MLEELGETQHVIGESEARLMRTAHGHAVAYNVQSAVDAKHGLIVHHEVTNAAGDNTQLEPIAKAAQQVLGAEELKVVADTGHSNGAQFEACEQAGITPYVPPNRSFPDSDSKFYTADRFNYDSRSDTYRCPAGKVLGLKQVNRAQLHRVYAARLEECACCAHKARCTGAKRRFVTRHWHEEAFERMRRRLVQAPDMMKWRRCLAEHPFGQIKCWVMGNGRLLLRGLAGARTEMALAVLARNLRRVTTILGNRPLMQRMARA